MRDDGLMFGVIIAIVFVVSLTLGLYIGSKDSIHNTTVIKNGCAEYDKTTGEFKLIDRSDK